MPDVSKKRNPNLVEPLPIEEEEGWSGYDLPDELTPRRYREHMARDYPKFLYLAQLHDYLASLVAKEKDDKSRYEKAVWAKKEEDKAESAAEFGLPVELLPYYKESRLYMLGERFQEGYKTYVQQYTDQKFIRQKLLGGEKIDADLVSGVMNGDLTASEAWEAHQQRKGMEEQEKQAKTGEQQFITRQRTLGGWDEKYGSRMAAAISAGAITEQEAEAISRRQLLSSSTVRTPEDREKLAEAVRQGMVTQEEAFGGDKGIDYGTPLRETTGQFGEPIDVPGAPRPGAPLGVDENGQPIQSSNAWERWQHAQAAEDNARRGLGQLPGNARVAYQPPGHGWERWQDEKPEVPQPLSAEYRGSEYEWRNLAAQQAQINARRQQRLADIGGYLMRDYADIYKSWQEKNVKPGFPESVSPTRFLQWTAGDEEGVENVEWQKAYTAREAERWREYGDIYPAYRSYAKKNYAEAKPFEEWQTTDPQAMAWMTDYKKRKMLEEQQARRRLAPQGIYRG